jgi:hypothetical protein
MSYVVTMHAPHQTVLSAGPSSWAVQASPAGLRLVPVRLRTAGSQELTWAALLSTRLSTVRVYVLYFPSRFELSVDGAAGAALEAFARQTSDQTSVNSWDPKDPHMDEALLLFDVAAPPALVLTTGLKRRGRQLLKSSSLYAISITERAVLGDRERLSQVVNSAHEVLMHGDADAIAHYIRKRDCESLLASVVAVGHFLLEQVAILKPKFQLPGGLSLELG